MNTPTALPRSKEGMRRTLENKLLFATIGSQKVKFGNSHGKSLRALVRPRKPNFNTEQEYRDDDIKRRRGIEQIMEARVKAGLEKDGEHLKWREIAEVDDKYAELEGEHRAWILAELNARVGNEPRGEWRPKVMRSRGNSSKLTSRRLYSRKSGRIWHLP